VIKIERSAPDASGRDESRIVRLIIVDKGLTHTYYFSMPEWSKALGHVTTFECDRAVVVTLAGH
jgi:hypothetical protein